ncbi:MAG: putative 1-deoxy-D-xylulose-5-phosphate synthase [Rhodospirillales bacterium]|jgi:transketolase|nr:putative 1-deoxy-D-xylulose-5-phosphate synthase [Rhodospirillales bacterium]
MDAAVKPRLMRDVVIETICAAARRDKDILFISADLGAVALDDLRRDLPNQFIHAGIAEQHMIDLASGLALSGKKVFCYAMAPFITARCYEQIKCVISSMNLPVTLIAVGVGLGYDHATLTHFTPEDIACMRALNGIEVLTPADEVVAGEIAMRAIESPAFRYLRLDRQAFPRLYNDNAAAVLDAGFGVVRPGKDVAIVACGALVHKALAAADILAGQGVSAGVIDLVRVKPINGTALATTFEGFKSILTVEEQLLEGGMGSAVMEALVDASGRLDWPVKRLGMRDKFQVVNGDRDHLHGLYGIDTPDIVTAAKALSKV